jgi:RNA polymerase sigma-70 factor, ECF subfamily
LRDSRGLPDSDLVAMFKNGHGKSGEELYNRYHGSVVRYCLILTGNSASAQDAAHDTFLTVVRSIRDLRDNTSFKGWLFRIARNACLIDARKRSRQLRMDEDAEPAEDITPLDLTLSGELHEMIESAVALLRPIYREALLLREYESLTYQEIAETTQTSLSTVKFRIHKARKLLADALGDYLDERNTP